MNISEVIKELNALIKEKYTDFIGSYLYGSQAREDFNEESDIDVVTLFEYVDRAKDLDVCAIVGELEYKYNIFIDFQIFTLEKLKLNPFYFDEVTQKGIFYAT